MQSFRIIRQRRLFDHGIVNRYCRKTSELNKIGNVCFMRSLSSNRSKLCLLPSNSTIYSPRLDDRINSDMSSLLDNVNKVFWNNVPKGFENFYPKEKKAESSKHKSKKKSSSSKKKKSSGGGGWGPNGNSSDEIGGLVLLALVLFGARSIFNDERKNGREITWSEFRNELLESGDVERIVVVNKKLARIKMRSVPDRKSTSSMSVNSKVMDESWDSTTMEIGSSSSPNTASSSSDEEQKIFHINIGSIEFFEEKLMTAQKELGRSPLQYVPVHYISETNWLIELLKFSPFILMIGFAVYLVRKVPGQSRGGGGGFGNIFQFGKSNIKKVIKEDVNVSFADVAGCQEAKREIMEFVDFLQDSSRFTKLGAKIPKGALLCGPPGTGKTLLAKAVAGEANVPFYSISGSDFVEMFVGVGPSRVRDLFKEARANAPCILFIDEIDAVGRKRKSGGFSGGNDERENTLNQLLVEMDGFTPSTAVVVLAGTNRFDTLDSALTRAGRFDRTIAMEKPDLKGRKEIFMVHLKGITLDGNIDGISNRLAGLTPGMTGADIANLSNEAAIVAARRKAESVSILDFEKAIDRIIGGMESHKIMSKDEKQIVAHHEAGHAVAGWFLEHADPLLKVTIIPRTSGALGFAQYLPKEIFLRTREQILDIVCMALAGRAAEEIFFGRVTTGATDDLRRVTSIAYSMIQLYGMNERVGQLAFPKDPQSQFGEQNKIYSDATAQTMDEEARSIVDAAYNRALQLLTERKPQVEKVAQMLLDKETITHDDIVDLIGPRPFAYDEGYQEFVSSRQSQKVDPQQELEENAANPNPTDDDSQLTPGLA